jgi:hypothetical protein
MEATRSFKMSVNFQQTTCRYIPEDRSIHLFCQFCVILLTSVIPYSSITSSLRLYPSFWVPFQLPFSILLFPSFFSVQHSDPHKDNDMAVTAYDQSWLPSECSKHAWESIWRFKLRMWNWQQHARIWTFSVIESLVHKNNLKSKMTLFFCFRNIRLIYHQILKILTVNFTQQHFSSP